MSVPYTSTFTVWRGGETDPDYGEVVYGAPTVFKGLFKRGGNLKLTDKLGQEFLPTSTYWTRLEIVSGAVFVPSNDDLIVMGDHGLITDPLTVNAQQIRGETIYDNSMFGQPVDYIFGTK